MTTAVALVLVVLASFTLCLELPRAIWPCVHGNGSVAPRRLTRSLVIGLGGLVIACVMVTLGGGLFGNGLLGSFGFLAMLAGIACLLVLPRLYFFEQVENLRRDRDRDQGHGQGHGRLGQRFAFAFAISACFVGSGVGMLSLAGA